jgi:hypothetical protein
MYLRNSSKLLSEWVLKVKKCVMGHVESFYLSFFTGMTFIFSWENSYTSLISRDYYATEWRTLSKYIITNKNPKNCQSKNNTRNFIKTVKIAQLMHKKSFSSHQNYILFLLTFTNVKYLRITFCIYSTEDYVNDVYSIQKLHISYVLVFFV